MIKSTPRPGLVNKPKLAAALAALLFMCPCASRAENRPLSLHDCIAIALGESATLEASRFDLMAAGEEIRAEQSKLFPSLTGSATGEMFSGSPTGKFGIVNTATPAGAGISANRQVDLAGVGVFGLKLTYNVFKDGSIFGLNDAPAPAAKRAQRDALAWTANLTREEVVLRVTQAFVAVVSAQNRAEPVDRRVSLLERSTAITKQEQQKGLLLPIDEKVVSEQLNGARALSKVIHEQAVAGSLELTRLLGLPASSHVRLVNTLPEPPEPPSAAQLLGASLGQHPSLAVQRATIVKAQQDYRLERFRLYPSVALHGAAIDVTDFDTDAHDFIGGVTVEIPIFDFGAQRALVRARHDTYHAEQARLGSVADDVVNGVVKIYEQIYALSESILTLQAEAGKLDRDLRVATSQQQQGITPPLTAIDAELALVGKREQLDVVQARRLLLYAELQKAMGGTWKWIR